MLRKTRARTYKAECDDCHTTIYIRNADYDDAATAIYNAGWSIIRDEYGHQTKCLCYTCRKAPHAKTKPLL